MFTVTPKKLKDEIIVCMKKGIVPLVKSSPGLGKSSIIAEIAELYNLKLIDLRLSQCTPEDLQGFPMRVGNKATFTPFDVFPLEDEDIPEGYDGWMLFLDELTSASKPVQAAGYKLILDRMVGSFHLHKRCVVVAAGNKMSDKAVVTQMSTALQSRVTHYELEPSMKDFSEYANGPGNIDYRIMGFLNYQPDKLMDFRPDHTDHTFACPRTWEFLSRLIQDEQHIDESLAPRIAGTIGSGCATEFITFSKEYDRIPKLRDILDQPASLAIPREASTKYATLSMMIHNHDEKNLDDLITYAERFPMEFQVIFVRGIVAKSPQLRSTHKGLSNYLREMIRYLDA